MVKRKVQPSSSSDERHEESPKKSKNSSNPSFIKTANLKSQFLHKGLNLNSSVIVPNLAVDSSSDGEAKEEFKNKNISKSKKKLIEVSKSDASENESDEYIATSQIDNETSHNVNARLQSSSKGKQSQEPRNLLKNKKLYEAFTPIFLSKEDAAESEMKSKVFQATMDNESNFLLMKSIEEKVEKVKKLEILEDIKISPSKSKDTRPQLEEIYPNLRPLAIKTKIALNNSDEIFLFRIPKNVDPNTLVNVEIDVKEGGKIDIGEKYIIRPTSKTPHPSLVVAKRSKILHFERNIVMEKYIKPAKEPKSLIVEKTCIPLPNDLKNRHPLFGSDFTEKINLDKSVEKKLDDAIKNLLKQDKKVKRKQIKKGLEEEKDEIVFNLLNSKSKFLNIKTNDSEKPDVALSKSSKKRKLTKNDIIENTLRQMKKELHTEYETDSGTNLHKKKKRRKSKMEHDRSLLNDVIADTNIKEEIAKDNNISLKKNKRSKVSPNIIEPLTFDSEFFEKSSKEKEKSYLEVVSDLSNAEVESSKSKKRKIKEELKEVKKKKKKKRDSDY